MSSLLRRISHLKHNTAFKLTVFFLLLLFLEEFYIGNIYHRYQNFYFSTYTRDIVVQRSRHRKLYCSRHKSGLLLIYANFIFQIKIFKFLLSKPTLKTRINTNCLSVQSNATVNTMSMI